MDNSNSGRAFDRFDRWLDVLIKTFDVILVLSILVVIGGFSTLGYILIKEINE